MGVDCCSRCRRRSGCRRRNCAYEVTSVNLSVEVNTAGTVVLVCSNDTVVAGSLSFAGREEETGTARIEVASWAEEIEGHTSYFVLAQD